MIECTESLLMYEFHVHSTVHVHADPCVGVERTIIILLK